jgi:hypothetical protein
MDLDAVADELYALPLPDFVATRTARAAAAKADDGGDLARQIRALPKPNQVAWLANQLTRQRRDQVRALLDLAEQFREATQTSDGDRIRELSRQRQQVLATLVAQAREIASAAGRGFSQDTIRRLEATLRAAMADPAAADQLSAGRLTDALQASGFGFGFDESLPAPASSRTSEDSLPAPAPKRTPAATRSSHAQSDTAAALPSSHQPPRGSQASTQRRKAIAAADRTVAAARSDASQAIGTLERAQNDVKQVEDQDRQIREEIARLRNELDDAQRTLADVQAGRRRLERDKDTATRAATTAQRRLERALATREELAAQDGESI